MTEQGKAQMELEFTNRMCKNRISCDGRQCYCMWDAFYLVCKLIGMEYYDILDHWKAIDPMDDLRDLEVSK